MRFGMVEKLPEDRKLHHLRMRDDSGASKTVSFATNYQRNVALGETLLERWASEGKKSLYRTRFDRPWWDRQASGDRNEGKCPPIRVSCSVTESNPQPSTGRRRPEKPALCYSDDRTATVENRMFLSRRQRVVFSFARSSRLVCSCGVSFDATRVH